MAKFTSKSDLKISLVNNITLVHNGNKFKWVEFNQIEEYLNNGFEIFNEDKKILYEKLKDK